MRPIMQLTTHELEGIRFMALQLFDHRGQPADLIVKPADDFVIVDTVMDVLRVHGIDTVDLETDIETAFKTFLSVPGVNVSFALPSDLQSLHNLFTPHSYMYPMLQEFYLPQTEQAEEQTQPDEEISLWRRFLNFIGGLIKRWKR